MRRHDFELGVSLMSRDLGKCGLADRLQSVDQGPLWRIAFTRIQRMRVPDLVDR